MGIFALSTLLVAGAGIYIFSKIFPNFQPGDKKIQADFEEMRRETEAEGVDLVPLAVKDMELLACEEEERSDKKGFTPSSKGRLATIFHEPVVLFRYKKYISTSGKDAVIYARGAANEYYFWIKPKGVKIVIDRTFVGTLENDEVLLGGKNRVVARFNRREDEHIPVIVEGREVGAIVKARPGKGGAPLSTRAFSYVNDDLSREEQLILMAMTIYELVVRQLN